MNNIKIPEWYEDIILKVMGKTLTSTEDSFGQVNDIIKESFLALLPHAGSLQAYHKHSKETEAFKKKVSKRLHEAKAAKKKLK